MSSDKVDAAGNLIEEGEPAETTASPEEMEAQIAELKKRLDHAKIAAYEASREIRESKKHQEKLEKKLAMEQQELADLRELVFNQQQNWYQDDTADESITFPYNTKLHAVVFGGHDSWAREIKPKLPDVRFIDREMLPNSDMIRRADVVWIQTNALSHAFFYKIIDEVRKYNVPLRYFSFASATKCAEQVARYDEEHHTCPPVVFAMIMSQDSGKCCCRRWQRSLRFWRCRYAAPLYKHTLIILLRACRGNFYIYIYFSNS